MDASELRSTFTRFFVERGHAAVPSAGLIPHHPAAPLLTNAGMNQFIPVFLGEEPPPHPLATSIQKCFRTPDIGVIGTTTRHLTFFEMLGNFSFGEYFKELAIPLAWEFVTEQLGLDPDRLWVTVYLDDEQSADLWHETVGLPLDRIQRMGDDNFWEMQKGAPGPCGPSSEIYYDKGERYGEAGGPAAGGAERFVEIWNLVFMQFYRQADGSLPELPNKNIDTGAGLERMLTVLQQVDSVFDTDVLRPIVATAESVTGRAYGGDEQVDVSLRILADHGRAMTFLVSDGVFPSNEDRGYVLRRVIRRAVRHAFGLGVEALVAPRLVETVVALLGEAYPELRRNADFIIGVVAREEERFRHTLRSGVGILTGHLNAGGAVLPGEVAFQLHDTFGFPVELTREIAAERGVDVDLAGFDAAMAEQRSRAKAARRGTASALMAGKDGGYREVLEQFGPTEFTGYREVESEGRILAVLEGADGTVEVFLDRTPFYAEGGGQVGDTGSILTSTGRIEVLDTTSALPGLHRHVGRLAEGEVSVGQEASTHVDAPRRESIRRNHTGTHLLHWALREVLGSHVKQAGSLVAPDRLRFDFSHYDPVGPEELARIEALTNELVLADEPVRAYETTPDEAARMGAIAFFGDKYGEVVRVVEAGSRSMELCGGTHVSALGMVGPIKVVSEGSIGANLRRVEALTGLGSLAFLRTEQETLDRAATLLRVRPEEVAERVERELEARRSLERELEAMRRQVAASAAVAVAATASDGTVVARRDGLGRDELRGLALAVRDQPGIRAVIIGGVPPSGGVSLVAAVRKESGLVASELVTEAARLVGGGGGRGADVAVAGGKDPTRLDDALALARRVAAGGGGASGDGSAGGS